MSVDDVHIVMQPNAEQMGVNPPLAVRRLTLQHFNVSDLIIMNMAPHNSDARQHVDHDDWPPPLLFDVSYGCAALNTWGEDQFVNLTRQRTRHIYYDDDDDENGNRGDRHARAVRRDMEKQEAQAVQAADSQTNFADIILGLWTYNARKGQRQARTMKAEEKVQAWLDSTKD